MKARGFAWFPLPLTLLLLTSYWCLQANGECLNQKCTFSEGDGQCGPSCRCYSDPDDPENPTTGVCAPHYETDETSEQSYPGNGQGAHYESGAGMGGAGALMYGVMRATQNLQLPAGAIQPGTSSSNSPSLRPPPPPPGTTSANKPSLPPKPAGNAQSPPQRPPLPPKPAGSPQSPPQRPPLPPKPGGSPQSRPQRLPLPPPRPSKPAYRPFKRPLSGIFRPGRG